MENIINSNFLGYFFNRKKLEPTKYNIMLKNHNKTILPLLYTNPKWDNINKRLIWKTFNQELEYSKSNYRYLYK